ncbi:MAG: tetratricopeptide repeat protein [Terriglobales bacterium]
MSLRSLASLLLMTLFFVAPLVAQRRGGAPRPDVRTQPTLPTTSSLTVYLVLPNEQWAGTPLRVQLLSAGGIPVGDTFSDSSGQARFDGLRPGSYVVRITGLDIEDTTTNFDIFPRESMHFERVYLRVKSASAPPTSKDGTVSAVALKVPEKAARELERGNKAAEKKDLEGAKKHYRKAIAIYPHYARAYNNLGLMCMQQKDYACAREGFEKAVAADPGLPSGYVHLAHIRLLERDAPAAVPLLEKALSITPLDPRTLFLMANACLLTNRYADAVLYAHKVHSVPHADFVVAHLVAGRALELQDRPQEAAVEYQTFLNEAPEHGSAGMARESLARARSSRAAAAPQP